MEPRAISLTSAEHRLMVVIEQRGLKSFVLAVTAGSVLLSVAITMPLLIAIDSATEELVVGLIASMAVPCIVAPLAATVLGRLLLALGQASTELHHLSRTDSLTGVTNRRAFITDGSALLERGGDGVFVVSMIDVDEFKSVNDRFGHPAGDQVLMTLADRLLERIDTRCIDGVVGRLGGDEFAVVAVVDRHDDAGPLIEALRAACVLDEVRPGVTASLGVHIVEEECSLDEALAHADHALYVNKQAAR
jgi:diguanylate cyclase (GGDEF)-like protein